MAPISFPTMTEALCAQQELGVPLAVFVHASNDGAEEDEEQALRDLDKNNEEFCFSHAKGRRMQLKALSVVLSMGCLERVTLVHTVQEGSTEYQQLTQAVPMYNQVPRVHLLSSGPTGPVLLALFGEEFTSKRLLCGLHRMLRNDLRVCLPSQRSSQALPLSMGSAKELLTSVLQQVEEINDDLTKKRPTTGSSSFSGLPPSRPIVSSSIGPSSAGGKALPSSSNHVSPPASEEVADTNSSGPARANPSGATIAMTPNAVSPASSAAPERTASPPKERSPDLHTKKRQSTSPLANAAETLPPSQRKKAEVIHLRCIIPSGKTITVENLSPVSSTIFLHVRPMVRKELGHDNFSFAVVKAGVHRPQHLQLGEEERTLESISITAPSSLRVVLSSGTRESTPGLAAKVGAFFHSNGSAGYSSGASVLQHLFGGDGRKKENARNAVGPGELPGSSVGRRVSNTLQGSGSGARVFSPTFPPSASSAKKAPSSYRYTPQSNIRTLSDVLEASREERGGGLGIEPSHLSDSNVEASDEATRAGTETGDNGLSMASLLRAIRSRAHSSQGLSPGEQSREDTDDEDSEEGEIVGHSIEGTTESNKTQKPSSTGSSGNGKNIPFSGKGRVLQDSNRTPSFESEK